MDNMDNIHHLSDNATSERSHNCARRRQVQKRTKKVCKQCPRKPGLCSAECFNSHHLGLGFELLPAAIKRPGGTTKCDRSKDKSLHYVVHKPPTESNEKPRGKCRLCLIDKKRKETYFQCNYCSIPFCNEEHLMEHHTRMGILDISENSSSEEQTQIYKDFSTQTEDSTTQSGRYEFQSHQYYPMQQGPATTFHDYYYNTRAEANDQYFQWAPPSSTPVTTPYDLNLAFQSTFRGTSPRSTFDLSVTPQNPDPVNDSLESASNLRRSPIGPRTPPELDLAEVPLDTSQDSSSQCKRPRRSESPRQSPKRRGSERQRTPPELDPGAQIE